MESKTRPALLHRVEVEKYIDPEAEWQTGFWLQYTTLTRRNFWSQRPRYFSKLHYGQKLFIGVIIGLVWFNLSRTEDTARDRLGVVIILSFFHFSQGAAIKMTCNLNGDYSVTLEQFCAKFCMSM